MLKVTNYDKEDNILMVDVAPYPDPLLYFVEEFEQWLYDTGRLTFFLEGNRKPRTMSTEQYWEWHHEQDVRQDLQDFIAYRSGLRSVYVSPSIKISLYNLNANVQ